MLRTHVRTFSSDARDDAHALYLDLSRGPDYVLARELVICLQRSPTPAPLHAADARFEAMYYDV